MYKKDLPANDNGAKGSLFRRCAGKRYKAEFVYVDTEEKTEPTDTDRLLLKSGKYRTFRVNGKAWTFYSTVLVDSSWDDTGYSGDLVDITRENFKDLEGARERSDTVRYLSDSQSTAIYPSQCWPVVQSRK